MVHKQITFPEDGIATILASLTGSDPIHDFDNNHRFLAASEILKRLNPNTFTYGGASGDVGRHFSNTPLLTIKEDVNNGKNLISASLVDEDNLVNFFTFPQTKQQPKTKTRRKKQKDIKTINKSRKKSQYIPGTKLKIIKKSKRGKTRGRPGKVSNKTVRKLFIKAHDLSDKEIDELIDFNLRQIHESVSNEIIFALFATILALKKRLMRDYGWFENVSFEPSEIQRLALNKTGFVFKQNKNKKSGAALNALSANIFNIIHTHMHHKILTAQMYLNEITNILLNDEYKKEFYKTYKSFIFGEKTGGIDTDSPIKPAIKRRVEADVEVEPDVPAIQDKKTRVHPPIPETLEEDMEPEPLPETVKDDTELEPEEPLDKLSKLKQRLEELNKNLSEYQEDSKKIGTHTDELKEKYEKKPFSLTWSKRTMTRVITDYLKDQIANTQAEINIINAAIEKEEANIQRRLKGKELSEGEKILKKQFISFIAFTSLFLSRVVKKIVKFTDDLPGINPRYEIVEIYIPEDEFLKLEIGAIIPYVEGNKGMKDYWATHAGKAFVFTKDIETNLLNYYTKTFKRPEYDVTKQEFVCPSGISLKKVLINNAAPTTKTLEGYEFCTYPGILDGALTNCNVTSQNIMPKEGAEYGIIHFVLSGANTAVKYEGKITPRPTAPKRMVDLQYEMTLDKQRIAGVAAGGSKSYIRGGEVNAKYFQLSDRDGTIKIEKTKTINLQTGKELEAPFALKETLSSILTYINKQNDDLQVRLMSGNVFDNLITRGLNGLYAGTVFTDNALEPIGADADIFQLVNGELFCKGCGDFFQEVVAVSEQSSYTDVRNLLYEPRGEILEWLTPDKKKQYTNLLRVFLANDRPSACRFMFMLTNGLSGINQYAMGGYYPKLDKKQLVIKRPNIRLDQICKATEEIQKTYR
jgi:hypothetical protein